MSDLVTRCKQHDWLLGCGCFGLLHEAVNEIERLTLERDEARKDAERLDCCARCGDELDARHSSQPNKAVVDE